jgi:hypothetical protein
MHMLFKYNIVSLRFNSSSEPFQCQHFCEFPASTIREPFFVKKKIAPVETKGYWVAGKAATTKRLFPESPIDPNQFMKTWNGGTKRIFQFLRGRGQSCRFFQ